MFSTRSDEMVKEIPISTCKFDLDVNVRRTEDGVSTAVLVAVWRIKHEFYFCCY